MGHASHRFSVPADDSCSPARPGLDGDGIQGVPRRLQPLGRLVPFGPSKPELLPDLDGGLSPGGSHNPPQHAHRSELHARDLPSAKQLLGHPDDREHDVGHPPRPAREEDGPSSEAAGREAHTAASEVRLTALARRYLQARERRKLAGTDLFGDPIWEVLLDLVAAEFEGRRISVKSACHGSGAPCSTALGYVGKLQEAGLIYRIGDKTDRRRTFVKPTDAGISLVTRWLDEVFIGAAF